MASSTFQVQSNKNVRRMQLRKSHSWWWDSHISPKNSKWLAENLEEMDQSIKRMLKLIEEDGDSFAKKAEMYYQRRPELVSYVEEFYRMYRSLAERYDHVTGELRKNIPSDLQSQGSGISDITSEPSSTWPSPAHDQKLSHRKSGPRAAGFEFFLGSGGSSSDLYQKEGDESSTLTDSEPESDDSSVNNYSGLFLAGNDQVLSRKIIELEIELREMKEKLQMQQDENGDGSFRGGRNVNSEVLLARIAGYEQELKVANERIRSAEEEASRLKIELKKYNSLESMDGLHSESAPSAGKDAKTKECDISDLNSNPQALAEQLKITKERLQSSEKEIASLKHQLDSDEPSEKISSLQDQLALAHKDANTWKTKLNAEKREVSKLQERISRLKTSLSDRDHEIRNLKIAVSDAEQNIFPEKAQIKADISKLLEERNRLEEQLREWESRSRALEDEIRMLQAEQAETKSKLKFEIEQLKVDIAERDKCIENLNKSLGDIKSERDEINAKVVALRAEVISRDDRIHQMDKHLHQLHMEHVELIAGAENARKQEDELRSKAKYLEKEVERQKIAILEGAEEKREAIRQLCFSLEHYRNGYQRLRQACVGHKRLPVLAT
uniref:RAB6-interacting protein n=1 Tax=Rhizophora mucronata TaxID=61149 RepID=A0A2P2JWU4_RHIMU